MAEARLEEARTGVLTRANWLPVNSWSRRSRATRNQRSWAAHSATGIDLEELVTVGHSG